MVKKKLAKNKKAKYKRVFKLKVQPGLEKVKKAYIKKVQKYFVKIKPILNIFDKYKTVILLGFLLLFMIINFLSYYARLNLLEKNKQKSLSFPWLAIKRVYLAQDYYNYGYEDQAKQLIQDIEKSPFLMRQILIFPEWQLKFDQTKDNIYEKDKLLAEVKKWEKWIGSNPPSRDIYLLLAQLNWQIGSIIKTQEYASKAAYLDPTNSEVLKMQELLKN